MYTHYEVSNVPKFQKHFPKDAKSYFNPASDEEFKHEHPIGYWILAICGIIALLLPYAIFLVITVFMYPAPNSGFLALGFIGTFIIGIGFFNIVAAFINQYLGHLVTLGAFLIGGALTALSCVILYTPDIYSLFDEDMVTFYFVNLFFLALPPIYYVFFRSAMGSWLERRKIRKREIRRLMKGKRNFWWYEAIHNEYGIGVIYFINKFVTIAYPIGAVLSVLFNWIKVIAPITSIINALVCLSVAVLSVFEMIQSNLDNYKAPFILLRITEDKRLDSSIFQLIFIAFILIVGYCHIDMMLTLVM